MPEDERRAIWGLMVGNEGRTRIAIYDYYNKAGFNPDTDMLQCPVMSPESFASPRKDWFQGGPDDCKFWKADSLRGISTDWNQMSSVDGLFASGCESSQGGAGAGSSGAYAGNRAAEYAMKVDQGRISGAQVAAEKQRVYAPVERMNDAKASISWKELWMGMNRVMQQDCNAFRTPATCAHAGLMWAWTAFKKQEMLLTYARNPHELARVLECESRVTVAEIYLHLSLANFKAAEDGVGKDKYMYNKLLDGELITTYKEDKWWLKPPDASLHILKITQNAGHLKRRLSEMDKAYLVPNPIARRRVSPSPLILTSVSPVTSAPINAVRRQSCRIPKKASRPSLSIRTNAGSAAAVLRPANMMR